MRMAILVQPGAAKTRRLVLKGGQIARFGRTEWADYTFTEDSQMAELHFAIQCGIDAGSIQALSPQHPTLVNDAPVEKSQLNHGDVIRAGQTSFLVQLDDVAMFGEASADASVESTASDQAARRDETLTLSKYIGLSNEANQLAGQCSDPNLFHSLLVEKQLLDDALRWNAHTLPKPRAIQWACQCVDANIQAEKDELQRNCWKSAVQFSKDPSEANRREAAGLAEVAQYEGIGGILAAATAWSGGSLADADQAPVLPDERLTGRSIHIALRLAAISFPPSELASRQQGFLSCLPKPSSTRLID